MIFYLKSGLIASAVILVLVMLLFLFGKIYAKDKNHAYYRGLVIKGVDVKLL